MAEFKNIASMLALITQLGIIMIVSVVFSTLVCVWLADRTGLGFLPVAGFAAGSAAGMKGCYRLIMQSVSHSPYDNMSTDGSGHVFGREDSSDEQSDTGSETVE